MGLRRAKAVREYLLEHFNIASRRIRTTSAGSSRSGGIIKGAGNDAYTEFRSARILLDEDSLDAANRRLSTERKTETSETEDGVNLADGEASADNSDETTDGETAESAEESAEASPAENVEENAENAGDAEYTGNFNADADTPVTATDSAEDEANTENATDEQNSEIITDSRDTIENTNGSNEPQGE